MSGMSGYVRGVQNVRDVRNVWDVQNARKVVDRGRGGVEGSRTYTWEPEDPGSLAEDHRQDSGLYGPARLPDNCGSGPDGTGRSRVLTLAPDELIFGFLL